MIAKYGKRYGYTAQQIAENPSLRQLLHDQINSDIFIASQWAEAESRREEEPTLETPRGNEPSATPAGPAEQRKQVSTIVERTRGPVVLNDLGLNAFGVKLLRTELMIEDAFGGYLQVDEVKHGTRS